MYYTEEIDGLHPANGYGCYYYYCPEYIDSVTKKFPGLGYRHFYYSDGHIVADLPWMTLFERGLARVNHLECFTCLEALLWGREDNVLRLFIEYTDKEAVLQNGYEWVYDYLVREDFIGAKKKFEQALPEKDELLPFSIIMFDDYSLFLRSVSRAEERSGSEDLCRLSKSFKRLLGSDGEARRLLLKAEQQASDSVDLSVISSLHQELFGDEIAARRLLAKAAAEASCAFDFLSTAHFHKCMFNDRDAGRKLLSEAETKSDTVMLMIGLAFAWKDILNDDVEARRLLQIAERNAETSHEFQTIGRYWNNIFRNEEDARRLLDRSEKQAKCTEDFCNLAKCWNKLFDEEKQVYRLFAEAQKKTESVNELKLIEQTRLEIFGEDSVDSE